MTEPITPLISLLGTPGAACEGDDCLPGESADGFATQNYASGDPGWNDPEAAPAPITPDPGRSAPSPNR